VREMAELLVLDLVEKQFVTNQLVLTVGYDIENLNSAEKQHTYKGEITTDFYGRKIPKHAHGTENLSGYTASARIIVDAVMSLYTRIVNPHLLVRRISLTAGHVVQEGHEPIQSETAQMELFSDDEAIQCRKEAEQKILKKEKQLQQTMVEIKQRYGKNAVLKGMNLQEGATARERNRQIGGHKA